MKSAATRKSSVGPSDKLLGILANELLDGGDELTVEAIEARYPNWSGAAWRRLRDTHLAAYKERHGKDLLEVGK